MTLTEKFLLLLEQDPRYKDEFQDVVDFISQNPGSTELDGTILHTASVVSDYYWDKINDREPQEDPEIARQLYLWTDLALGVDRAEYYYRMGTLCSCAVGCPEDTDRAVDMFVEAYARGDWRGAQAIAAMLATFLKINGASMTTEERKTAEAQIEQWLIRATKMHSGNSN